MTGDRLPDRKCFVDYDKAKVMKNVDVASLHQAALAAAVPDPCSQSWSSRWSMIRRNFFTYSYITLWFAGGEEKLYSGLFLFRIGYQQHYDGAKFVSILENDDV